MSASLTLLPPHLPSVLPVLALRRGVLLPGVVQTVTVGRDRSVAALNKAVGGYLIVAAQRDPKSAPEPGDLLGTAVIAQVVERRPNPKGGDVVVLKGLSRVNLTGFTAKIPSFEATWRRVDDEWPASTDASALRQVFEETALQTAEMIGGETQVREAIEASEGTSRFVDLVASFLAREHSWETQVLQTADAVTRAQMVLTELVKTRELIAAKKAVQDRVNSDTRDMQRTFVLRQQLEAIRKELGEVGEDGDELQQLKEKLDARELPDEARKVVERELKRLARVNPNSPEKSVAVDWLEWVADLPWNVQTAVDVDMDALESALDQSHYGLDDLKRQVLEYMAVRRLAGSGRADVLLLVGPPGVGKTSIAQAIADASGRKLLRAALGGVRDEAELRGHRRTYIGARPGRIIEGLRRAGSADPVVLLDEVDKLSRGYTGNPAAALLEILDPEQNSHFVDHYLEMPFDLSKALFIATANDLSQIPAPLLDRMEILEIAGYAREEKLLIARRHLLRGVAENAGLKVEDVEFTDGALKEAIAGWTREAGVRQLQRVLGKAYRQAAVLKARGKLTEPLQVNEANLEEILGKRKIVDALHDAPDRPGIATGLAWTPVGGDVLYVEASTLPGKGGLVLTGQLGDVMKESARAALTYVLAHHDELGIPRDALEGKDVHVHVPAGAVPKDGPSAGVTMFTALASLLTGRSVRPDTAMTGEATLRGRVLPVGGIKSKVLAAHRLGLKRIILPRLNGRDLDELPQDARDAMEFILVDSMADVLAHALVEVRAANTGVLAA